MTGSKSYSIQVLIKEKRTITTAFSKLTQYLGYVSGEQRPHSNEKKKNKEIYNDLPYLFMHITDVKTLYRFWQAGGFDTTLYKLPKLIFTAST